MVKLKKILFLIENLNGGGAERVLVDLVNNLDSKKFQITVRTIWNEGIYIGNLNSNIMYKPMLKYKRHKSILNSIIVRLFKYWLSPKWIYEHYIRDDYDIEIAFLEGLSTKYIAASTNTKAKKLAWVHTDLYHNFYTEGLFETIGAQKEAYKKFDRICCVSYAAKEAFKARFGFDDTVQVIYNILDDEEILKKAKEDSTGAFKSPIFRLVAVGRLIEKKGFDRLIKIAAALKEKGYSFELCIIGEGREYDTLERGIQEYNLAETVLLLGFKSNPYPYIFGSDLLVCPSRVEGFSLVVAEALILGVPVVSTDCTGPNELLGYGKYGLIVENDQSALMCGIIELMDSREKYKYYKEMAKKRGCFFKKRELIKAYERLFNDEIRSIKIS